MSKLTVWWLDPTAKSTKNEKTRAELCEVIGPVQTFEQIEVCEKSLREHDRDPIILIVSGGFGREIIPRVYKLPQLSQFYVYCQNRKINEEWASQFPKNKGVYTALRELINALAFEGDNNWITVIKGASEASKNARNAKFLWFQLFVDVLIRVPHQARDREDLIEYCRKSDLEDQKDIEVIDNFESTYQSKDAIRWYTNDSCLYRIMNKALRHQDFEALYAFRCFITDVAKQLETEYQNYMRTISMRSEFTVYRGQVISIAELDMLKESTGGYVSMSSFLSTSKSKDKAFSFVRQCEVSDHTRRILFEITIDPRSKTKPFADVKKFSLFETEEEVLIMVGALFRINRVFEDRPNQIWIARVSLADEANFELKHLLDRMRADIGDETNGGTLAKILLRMDLNGTAKRCYQKLLQQSELVVADHRMGLGCAFLRCGNIDDASKCLHESLVMRQKLVRPDHPSLGIHYAHLSELYQKTKDYPKALEYLKEAVQIQERVASTHALELADTYDNLGRTYTKMGNYKHGERYFNKALQIRLKELPEEHPQLAGVYSNLGWLFECAKQYKDAMQCYEKALEIGRKTLPSNHRLVTGTAESIRRLKQKGDH